MKYVLLLMILLSTVFSACSIIDVTTVSNINFTLDQNSCITINNSNISIFPKDVRTNQNLTLNAPTTIVDPISNNSYRISSNLVNLNKTLEYGECYTNSINQEVICSKSFPLINKIYTVQVGSNISDSQYNFTIFASGKSYNISKTAEFGESLQIPEANINFTCPLFPVINEIINMQPGEMKLYEKYRLTIFAPAKLNVKKILQSEEHFTNDAYGIDLAGATKLNKYITLVNSTKYSDPSQNFTIEYKLSNDQYSLMCGALFNRTPDIWYNVNASASCSSLAVPVCADPFLSYCKADDLLQANGIVTCTNRVVSNAKDQINSSDAKLNDCSIRLKGFTDADQQKKDNAQTQKDDLIDLLITISTMVIILGGIIVAYLKHQEKKKVESEVI